MFKFTTKVFLALLICMLLAVEVAHAEKGDFDISAPIGITELKLENGVWASGFTAGMEAKLSFSRQFAARFMLAGQSFSGVPDEEGVDRNASAIQYSLGALYIFHRADFFMEPDVSIDLGGTHFFTGPITATRATVMLGGGLTYRTRYGFFYGPRLRYDWFIATGYGEAQLQWAFGYRF